MARKDVLQWTLPERDLNFLVGMAAPEAADKEALKRYVKEDPTFRESMVVDRKVFAGVSGKTPLNLGISPELYFEVLLRAAMLEMEKKTHTVERSSSQRIPIFDIRETLEFLRRENVISYLVHLLSSFVAVEKGTLRDIDIDALFSLGKAASGQTRFLVYKRIADVCLFVLGITPEYLTYDYCYLFSKQLIPLTAEPKRSMSEYEGFGQAFYDLASKEKSAEIAELDRILQMFSDNFNLAKKPLNYLSEHYFNLAQRKSPESA